ncbi:MAG: hypothetical protein ACM3ML_05470 [Micromonosporaceae bacterium]
MTHRWTPSPDDPRQTDGPTDDRADNTRRGRRGRHGRGLPPDSEPTLSGQPGHLGPDPGPLGVDHGFFRPGPGHADPHPGYADPHPGYTDPGSGYADPLYGAAGTVPGHRTPDYRAQGYRREDFQRPAGPDGAGHGNGVSGAGRDGREFAQPGEMTKGLDQGWVHPLATGTPQVPRGIGPHSDLVTYPGWGAAPESAEPEFQLYGPAETDPHETESARAARSGRHGRIKTSALLGIGGVLVIIAAAVAVFTVGFGHSGHHAQPTAPATMLATPPRIGDYTRDLQAEQELGISHGEHYLTQIDPGHVSGIVAAVYDTRAVPGSPDSAAVIAGRLGSTPAAVVIKSFMQQETAEGHQPVAIAAGPLGGKAACAGSKQSAICVWVDKDTVGVVVSAAMNARKLASVALTIRSGVEVPGKAR